MPARKYVHLLSREEVQEVALHVGKPPAALVGGAYRRITPQAIDEQEVIAVLAAIGGLPHLPSLADGRVWEHDVPIGRLRVKAAYDRDVLKVSLRLTSRATDATAESLPQSREAEPAAPRAASAAQPRPAQLEPVPAPPAPAAPATFSEPPPKPAAVVITAHDAFNFEEDRSWTSKPSFDAAPQPKKAPPPKFKGDLFDELLGSARDRNASDVHVLADRPPTLRIAGDLVAAGDVIDAARAEELILPRVPEAQRAILERDGSCDFSLLHQAYGRFRVNVSRQRTGIKLTARPIGAHVPTLAELGLPESIAQATHHHQGLIVITGPTGHGKTTTLAAVVGIINRETTHHVITVEDPIEYVHPFGKAVISQREVGSHTKTFQAALKGSLREDPDVIVVGELRDTETVRMALSASETGHLVISTMNTPSAAKAIERLIDLFPPGDQPQVRMTLAGGLRLIVSQRLLPNADGTGLCAAAEVLPGNLPLWNLIRENRTFQIASLQQRGKALGIIRLDESLAQLVRAGRTTMEKALEYAEQPEHLPTLVAGKPIPVQPQDKAQPQQPAQPARTGGTLVGVRAPQPGAANPASPAGAAGKKVEELGKSVLSRAGRLFGSE